MKDYKQWSASDRARSQRYINKAKELGLISAATECYLCGRSNVLLQDHCEDYDPTLNILPKMIKGEASSKECEAVLKSIFPVCVRCHRWLHIKDECPADFANYIVEVVMTNKMTNNI